MTITQPSNLHHKMLFNAQSRIHFQNMEMEPIQLAHVVNVEIRFVDAKRSEISQIEPELIIIIMVALKL